MMGQQQPPADLGHAGSVVDKAIEYMTGQNIAPLAIASALLGAAVSLLSRSIPDEHVMCRYSTTPSPASAPASFTT